MAQASDSLQFYRSENIRAFMHFFDAVAHSGKHAATFIDTP
jgi:hypothetical protein